MPPKSSVESIKTKNSPPVYKTIGYLRVSTNDQELEKNKSDILHLANHPNLGRVNFVEEIVSGKVSWKKRKIAEVIAEFQKGDNLDRQRVVASRQKYARMYGDSFSGG